MSTTSSCGHGTARLRLVEAYAQAGAWDRLTEEKMAEFGARGSGLASLPTELPAEDEEAKRFDLLMLRLQLVVLCAEPGL